MKIKQMKLIYFSPTGSTKKILENIAKGISCKNVEHIDLTLPTNTYTEIPLISDELVIIGAPVYGGRLPVEAVRRFGKLRANNTPAVLVVVYGNRAFEDSLIELKNLSIELGFQPVAAGAFIAEHSFSTKEIPLSKGRPDEQDTQKAKNWGAEINNIFNRSESVDRIEELNIPGRYPYEAKMGSMSVSPVTDKSKCNLCAKCADVCPTASIIINENVICDSEKCIRCSACIKSCPSAARHWEDLRMKKIFNWLNENFSDRRTPELYGPELAEI